ncbi:MAG: malonyl-CoA decarboxylase family protein [Aeromicrobium sp.]|nr:malonyl-CoA decarboxylase family protein [Burkholderiales bacterium]
MIFDSLKRSTRSQPTSRDSAVRRLVQACHELLSEEGEASGATRAKETLAQYAALDAAQRISFFQALKTDFSPNPEKVLEAAHAYAHEPSSINLAVLSMAAEPPRQELLRRLNRAPGGTHAIVGMRVKLLDALRKDVELAQVDDDFRHLLSSWFNPGFLELRRVDWNAPATLLEQVIQHEAVHEVRDWNDLRRRLQQDRRCFGFFHPAIAGEPLIFVEVALLPSMAAEIGPLIDTHAAPGDAAGFQTAVFYSISNCQPGLRGVSLGNFLIKQVVDTLSQEFPRIREFCTLSPIPGFREWLKDRVTRGFAPADKRATAKLRKALVAIAPHLASFTVSASELRGATTPLAPLKRELTTLCAAYLLGVGEDSGTSSDAVAKFHLNNGARLDRLNWRADDSDKGLKQSLGMMVNYVYEPKRIERNHEQFVRGKTIAAGGVEDLV